MVPMQNDKTSDVRNIAFFLEDHLNRHGEITSLIFEEKEYTNTWFRDQANRLANGLKSLGIKENDKVAVSLDNCPEVIVIFQAVLRIGAVIAPIMFQFGPEETEYILDNCDATVFITQHGADEKIQKAVDNPAINHIITLNGEKSQTTVPFEELIKKSSAEFEIAEKGVDDIALLIYTAGTTGKPKGVMLSHGSLSHQAIETYALWDDEPRIGLTCLPLAHMFGVSFMLNDQMNKDPRSFSVMMRWFDPQEMFRLIEKYKVTATGGVPTMFWFLLHDPKIDDYDLSSLTRCVVGAAPVLDELYNDYLNKLNVELIEAYGLSESCSGIACTHSDQIRKSGSAGTAIGEAIIKIFDENDNELPPGEAGEIVIGGPTLMKGYYKKPEETAKTIRGGWLYSGDVGCLDEEGYLFITDRKKDMIIKGGENVFPSEIENVLQMHPLINEAAVIGIKDVKYGENILAFVIKMPGTEITEDEVIKHCHENYTKFKCPSQIKFVDDMPRSGVGKILKKELRKLV